MQKKPIG